MTQDVAYTVMMSLTNQARLRNHMQRTVAGEWDVVVDDPKVKPRTLHTREEARAFWRQLQREGVIAS